MPLDATNPKIIPAVDQVTFDKWTVKRLVITQDGDDDPTQPYRARVVLRRATADGNGVILKIDGSEDGKRELEVADIFEKASADSRWMDAITIINQLIEDEAKAQNAL